MMKAFVLIKSALFLFLPLILSSIVCSSIQNAFEYSGESSIIGAILIFIVACIGLIFTLVNAFYLDKKEVKNYSMALQKVWDIKQGIGIIIGLGAFSYLPYAL